MILSISQACTEDYEKNYLTTFENLKRSILNTKIPTGHHDISKQENAWEYAIIISPKGDQPSK
jgi:hypothetical protein